MYFTGEMASKVKTKIQEFLRRLYASKPAKLKNDCFHVLKL